MALQALQNQRRPEQQIQVTHNDRPDGTGDTVRDAADPGTGSAASQLTAPPVTRDGQLRELTTQQSAQPGLSHPLGAACDGVGTNFGLYSKPPSLPGGAAGRAESGTRGTGPADGGRPLHLVRLPARSRGLASATAFAFMLTTIRPPGQRCNNGWASARPLREGDRAVKRGSRLFGYRFGQETRRFYGGSR